MGIQINGQTDRISAVDGSFSIQDLAEVNVTGVATASNFKTGTSNVHSTGYECANINATGIVTAASANFTGNVSIGGTLTYQDVTNIDSVGIITAQSDISIADKIVHTGDTNTALRFPAADTFTVETSGSEALRVDSSQRLLVNTDSAMETFGSAALQVATAAGGTLVLGRDDTSVSVDNGLGAIYFDTKAGGSFAESAVIAAEADAAQGSGDYPSRLVFKTTADGAGSVTERLRITSGGSVAIGVNSPSDKLHVGGNNAFIRVDRPNGNPGLTLIYNSTNSTRADIDVTTGGDLRFATNSSTERLRIKSDGAAYFSGNLGLGGQTSPSGTIHINDLSANGYELKVTGNALQFNRSSNSYIDQLHNSGSILFRMTSSNTEAMRITSSGLVGIDVTSPATQLDVNGTLQLRASGNTTYATRIYSRLDSTHCSVIESYLNSGTAFEMMGTYADGGGANPRVVISAGGKNVGINETSPDTNLHISRSSSQNDTHGILKVESTSTGTGAATNAGIISKNRYGWSQFMQWEENGLRVGSRSTSTGGTGTVTVTYGSDNTGAVINQNGVVTMPQQCGFHVVLHTSQTLTNNGMVNLWDTDASDSRSYIKNMTFNAGRFVAPVSGLYYFTAQLLLSGVASSDDSIHIAWTTGSGNDTFAYWNTRHDGASANGSYGYGGYLPVTGSTTVYLAANAIFGIRANFTGGIGIHGTDANWGHWSGFLVG